MLKSAGPSEAGFDVTSIEMNGLFFHPLRRVWMLLDERDPLALQVNYMAVAQKPGKVPATN